MNKVLLGGVVDRPDERRTQDNRRVLSFTLITTETYQDKEFKSYHQCSYWRGDVTVAAGEYIVIEGKLKYRKRTDIEDRNVYVADVNVSSVERVGGRPQDYPPVPKGNDDDDLPF